MTMKAKLEAAYARLVAAINAVDNKLANVGGGGTIDILPNDPLISDPKNIWVLESSTTEEECGGFFGAMPIMAPELKTTHVLSVRTPSGIKRLELL